MESGDQWQVMAVRREAVETMREAARRAGMSVGEWLDSFGGNIVSALEERVAALADTLETRSRGGQSVPYELAAVIKELIDKTERLHATRNTALDRLEDQIAGLVEKLEVSNARLNRIEAVERGLAELLIRLEHQGVPIFTRKESSAPEFDALLRDLAGLGQMEKRTQELLEIVQGTLGHIVDRLVTIETDMRGNPARPTDSSLRTASLPTTGQAAPKLPASAQAATASAIPASKAESPPKASDAGGTLNFIAAARRAAQAAEREPPAKSAVSGPGEIASVAGKPAGPIGKLRTLIAGIF